MPKSTRNTITRACTPEEYEMRRKQMTLPIGPIRNNNLFSNHWLENRLHLEPEWQELREQAETILDRLSDLWERERDRVADYGNEAGLEHAFIQPVLETLGWRLKYQTFLRGRKPDYALFLDDASLRRSLKAGRTSPSFWNHPIVLADAKAWDHTLDRPIIIKRRRKHQREYPPEQMESYLQHSQLDYAIITNGRLWRLIPRTLTPEQPRFETYIECDLARIMDRWAGTDTRGTTDGLLERPHNLEDFLLFYLFFTPAAFLRTAERASLIERAAKGSSEYRLGVGEGLKAHVFEALRISIEGFLTFGRNNLDSERDLAHCHEESFILLYRLLFIMYAEDRRLLPYDVNGLYTKNRSLGRFRDELAHRLDRIDDGRAEDYSCDSTDIWRELQSLFDLIDVGGARYGVPAYNGGLFDREQHPFLAEKALPDCHLARVIDRLGRAIDAKHPEAGLCRVDYRDLAIQHLGTIYEGLLELRSYYAHEPMVVIRKRSNAEERVIRKADPTPESFERTQTRYRPGQVYLVTHKGERHSTGSYYTPNHIVDYIVERTLSPLCQGIDFKLQTEIKEVEAALPRARGTNRQTLEKRLLQLRTAFDDRILSLRILDPAMGSGHFLLRACQYLAEEIATNPNTGEPEAGQLQADESVLTFWKRRIVEDCLYGADINPLAVELAKLALWLETVAIKKPLSFLDHHLRHGNSLVGANIENLAGLPGEKELLQNIFSQQVQQHLPVLLEPLAMIRRMPSDTAEQVKEKDRVYHKVFDPARRPFMLIADLWCSFFFADPSARIDAGQYHKAVTALENPKVQRSLEKEKWFLCAVAAARRPDVAAFHWELEFPEVFFDATHRRPEAGFHAVIGNPPYLFITEQKKAEKAYYGRVYKTYSYRYDIYGLFTEKAFSGLLAPGGRFGFITPHTLLNNDSFERLRRFLLAGTTLETILDLGPGVFQGAKNETMILIASKGKAPPDHACRVVASNCRLEGVEGGHDIKQADLYDMPKAAFPITTGSEELRLLRRLRSISMNFGDLCTINQGLRTGDNKKYLSPERKRKSHRPVVGGKHIGRYIVRGNLFVDYLPDELDAPRSESIFTSPEKIIVQEVRNITLPRRIVAAYDDQRLFCLQSTNVINVRDENRAGVAVKFLLGLLNSRLLNWFFRASFPSNNHIASNQLAQLPVVCPGTEIAGGRKQDDQILGLVDRMLDLSARLAKAPSGEEKTPIQQLIDRTDWEIDALVYELYDLTEEEIGIVEKVCE